MVALAALLPDHTSAHTAQSPGTPDCGVTVPPVHEAVGGRSRAGGVKATGCLPAYETPAYASPPDDGVALGALLEASGYSGGATVASPSIAAGILCGDQRRGLFISTNVAEPAGRPPHPVGVKNSLALLQGRVPSFLARLQSLPEDDPRGLWRIAGAARLDPA